MPITLKVFIDGQYINFQINNDVKVVVEGVSEEAQTLEQHYTFTHEGIIQDTVLDGEVVDEGPSDEYDGSPPECDECDAEILTLTGEEGRGHRLGDGTLLCEKCYKDQKFPEKQ